MLRWGLNNTKWLTWSFHLQILVILDNRRLTKPNNNSLCAVIKMTVIFKSLLSTQAVTYLSFCKRDLKMQLVPSRTSSGVFPFHRRSHREDPFSLTSARRSSCPPPYAPAELVRINSLQDPGIAPNPGRVRWAVPGGDQSQLFLWNPFTSGRVGLWEDLAQKHSIYCLFANHPSFYIFYVYLSALNSHHKCHCSSFFFFK